MKNDSGKSDADSFAELKRRWWWFDPLHYGQRNNASAAWEVLRRTQAYRDFWREADAIPKPPYGDLISTVCWREAIRALIFTKKPPRQDRRDWLPCGEHDPVLQWHELFFKCCHPDQNWIQLKRFKEIVGVEKDAKGKAVAVIRGDKERTGLENLVMIPRQERAEHHSAMTIGIVKLEFDPSKGIEKVATEKKEGNERKVTCWWPPNKPPADAFPVQPKGIHSRTYVVVTFELELPTAALKRLFDKTLKQYLRLPLEKSISDIDEENIKYPSLWQGAFPKQLSEIQAHTRENVVCTPSSQAPYALCWIPARNRLRTLRERFHNAIRTESLHTLREKCRRYWLQSETVIHPETHEAITLPPWPATRKWPAKLKRKPGNPREIWLGLSAYDCRLNNIKFTKTGPGQAALNYFWENGGIHNPDADLVRPALAVVRDRIDEVNRLYCRILE